MVEYEGRVHRAKGSIQGDLPERGLCVATLLAACRPRFTCVATLERHSRILELLSTHGVFLLGYSRTLIASVLLTGLGLKRVVVLETHRSGFKWMTADDEIVFGKRGLIVFG